MELEIIKKIELPLLQRKRIIAFADTQGATPSNKELRQELASKLKVEKKLIAIRHVYPQFGKTKAKVIAHIYNNFDLLKKFETKEAKKIEEESKPAEKKEEPKAENKEEPKAKNKEEPKTENKEESKPAEKKEEPKAENKEESKGE